VKYGIEEVHKQYKILFMSQHLQIWQQRKTLR